jgi:hypothetical protein
MANPLKGPGGKFLPKPKPEELPKLELNEDGEEVTVAVVSQTVDPLGPIVSL